VHLRKGEEVALASHLSMEVMFFTEKFTALSPDRRGLVLKDNPDGTCSLLEADGLCRVNDVKPAQCRAFPFSWTNSDSTTICPALAELRN
jgi:Fe-S-cluster containining protein